MSSKNIPIYIYNSEIRYKPNIVIPIKYFIEKKNIEHDGVYFKIKKGNNILKRKRIVIVKKSRKSEADKYSNKNTINN